MHFYNRSLNYVYLETSSSLEYENISIFIIRNSLYHDPQKRWDLIKYYLNLYLVTLSSIPPSPRLLKITQRIPIETPPFTKHLMYSACEPPVNPGNIITIGLFFGQPLSIQSNATSPPSASFKISLKKHLTIARLKIIIRIILIYKPLIMCVAVKCTIMF